MLVTVADNFVASLKVSAVTEMGTLTCAILVAVIVSVLEFGLDLCRI